MKRQDKSLLEVFPGAFRDPDLAEIAAQLSVRQIRISKEQRRANIYASANTFYSPYWVLDLKKTISSHLDNRLKINIEIQYPFEDPMEHVEDYWDVAHIMMNGRFAATRENREGVDEKPLEQLFFEITERDKGERA